METSLVAALLVVYAINLAPAFMPPTWAILAFLHLALGLPVLPLAIGGAVAASLGRYSLALAARRYGIRLVPERKRRELVALGAWLDARPRWAAPAAMLLYSFGPIPSNQLFVAAGLTGMSLGPVVGAFLAGRLVSYPLWVATARIASSRLEDLFTSEWSNVWAILLNVVLLGLLVVFVRIDWSRVVAGLANDPREHGLRLSRGIGRRAELTCIYCGHALGEVPVRRGRRPTNAELRAAYATAPDAIAPAWDAHGAARCPRCAARLFVEVSDRHPRAHVAGQMSRRHTSAETDEEREDAYEREDVYVGAAEIAD